MCIFIFLFLFLFPLSAVSIDCLSGRFLVSKGYLRPPFVRCYIRCFISCLPRKQIDVAENMITDLDSNGKVRLRVDTWAFGSDMLCCVLPLCCCCLSGHSLAGREGRDRNRVLDGLSGSINEFYEKRFDGIRLS